ncbi:hypothetical protein DFH28DRAFT_1079766 [Melampsora americana]|nr:hypothetical protein DFH28DRAFT_1079766 [Melampsora americana]
MGDINMKNLQNKLEELIEHEEELREAYLQVILRVNMFRAKEASLRSLRQCRTITENHTLASLPGNIEFLEEEINRILLDLGGNEFRDIPEASGWDPTANMLPIQLVTGIHASGIVTRTTWKECTKTVESVYHGLFLGHARVIFAWNPHLLALLHDTHQYSEATIAEDNVLEERWRDLLRSKLE